MLVQSVWCHFCIKCVRIVVIQWCLQWIGTLTTLLGTPLYSMVLCNYTFCQGLVWHSHTLHFLWTHVMRFVKYIHMQVWENPRLTCSNPTQVILWLTCHMWTWINCSSKTNEYCTLMCKLWRELYYICLWYEVHNAIMTWLYVHNTMCSVCAGFWAYLIVCTMHYDL